MVQMDLQLYLEGKVQREHFFKNKALRIPQYPMAHPIKPVLQKPGKFTRLSSVGLKMADG
jgi:hypothetical protein